MTDRVSIPISPELAERLDRASGDPDDIADQALATLPVVAGWASLSPAELRIAVMIALGATRAEIAVACGISGKTVDTHRGHVLHKLGLRSSVALTRYAIRCGVVGTEESAYEVGPPANAGKIVPPPRRAPAVVVGRRDEPGTLHRRPS